MASETVEQVYTDVAERVKVARSLGEDSVIHNSAVAALLHNINNRYLAACKRDITAERSIINGHLNYLQNEIDRISAERDGWQKQALEENAALDVARAELAAKDAEIAKRDALIRELADALEKTLCDFECEKTGKCISFLEDTDPVIDCPALRERELVAKAREVCK